MTRAIALARPSRQRVAHASTAKVAYLDRDDTSILSPLRYPGSKRRLASFIAHTLELNDLEPPLFVEPFAGGSSVALQLLHDERVEMIGLADRDPLIAAFWQTVFWDTEWLVKQISTISVTLTNWRRKKHSKPRSRRQRAIKCLFLNRTSFSGILASDAGPIGGYGQKSDYKIDCRFPRDRLIKRVRQAAALRDRVAFVWNDSWEKTIAKVQQFEQAGVFPRGSAFFYLDPPFFEKADALYPHFFTDEDHQDLRNRIIRFRRRPWMISYDASPRAVELYDHRASNVHVELLYSSSGSRKQHGEREVIITNLPIVPYATRLWRRWPEHKKKSNGK